MSLFYQQGLFLLQLGAATTITPTPPSDITFECAFTCDIDQNLWFTATVTGPDGNYVVQIQVEDNWCLLYDAYLSITDAEGDTPGTGTYENDEPIALPAQIVMGICPIRVLDVLTGNTSAPVNTWVADCRQGQGAGRYGNGGWPFYGPDYCRMDRGGIDPQTPDGGLNAD